MREATRQRAVWFVLALAAIALVTWFFARRAGRTWDAEISREISHAGGLQYSEVKFSRGGRVVTCAVATFGAGAYEIVVIDNGPTRSRPRFESMAHALQAEGCAAGVNGGFFDMVTFIPNGLMVSDSRFTGEFDPFNWAGGVFAVRQGEPLLEVQSRFRVDESLQHLLQTGPWLLRNGRSMSRFTGEHPAERTCIATDGGGKWLLARASPVTLADFSEILGSRAMTPLLDVREALNLDGGPSSGFWFGAPRSSELVYERERSVVRNFLGVRKRTASAGYSSAESSR